MKGKRKLTHTAIIALVCLLMLGGCMRAGTADGPVVSEAPAGLTEAKGSGDVITINSETESAAKAVITDGEDETPGEANAPAAAASGKAEMGSHEAKVTKETSPSLTSEPKEEAGTGKMIAIDPGHQAKGNAELEPVGPGAAVMKAKVASGTRGTVTGIPEYKLTLAVSLKLKEELQKRGYRVYMIRETNDVNISNAERAKMANESGADIFIRIHANSLSDSSVRGTLTMCQTPDNPYNGKLYEKSYALSERLAKDLSAAAGFKNRGVGTSDTMSGINWCSIPVSIVEMGFMSNAEEDRKMAEDECRNQIVRGIADGIDEYYAAGY